MGGSFSAGGSTSRGDSSSRSGIDDRQFPVLADLWSRAGRELIGSPVPGQTTKRLQYYPGQSIAGRDAATLEADEMALAQARGGNAATNAGQQYTIDSLQGKYLDPASNPYLSGMYDNAAESVTKNFNRVTTPNLQSRFARAGQSMSGGLIGATNASQDILGDDLRRLATDVYGSQYNADRGRQEAAAERSFDFADEDRARTAQIAGVGEGRENFVQSYIDDLMERYEFARDEPYLRLSRYADLLGQPVQGSVARSSNKSLSAQIAASFGK